MSPPQTKTVMRRAPSVSPPYTPSSLLRIRSDRDDFVSNRPPKRARKMPSLPEEVLLNVFRHLSKDGRYKTLATVLRVSKAIYASVAPFLFKKVVLTAENAFLVLPGIQKDTTSTSPPITGKTSRSKRILEVRSITYDEDQAQRVIDRFACIQELTIKSFPSDRHLTGFHYWVSSLTPAQRSSLNIALEAIAIRAPSLHTAVLTTKQHQLLANLVGLTGPDAKINICVSSKEDTFRDADYEIEGMFDENVREITESGYIPRYLQSKDIRHKLSFHYHAVGHKPIGLAAASLVRIGFLTKPSDMSFSESVQRRLSQIDCLVKTLRESLKVEKGDLRRALLSLKIQMIDPWWDSDNQLCRDTMAQRIYQAYEADFAVGVMDKTTAHIYNTRDRRASTKVFAPCPVCKGSLLKPAEKCSGACYEAGHHGGSRWYAYRAGCWALQL